MPLCTARDLAIFGPFAGDLQGRDAVELRGRRQIFEARHHVQRRRLPQPDQEPAGHARRRKLLVAHRLQRAQGAYSGHRSRVLGASARAWICRSPAAAQLEVRLDDRQPVRRRGRASARAIACRRFRSISSRRPPTTERGSAPTPTGMSTAACSGSATATRSRATRSRRGTSVRNLDLLRSGNRTSAPAPTDVGSFKLPAYTLVNASVGLKLDRGLEFRLREQHLRQGPDAVARSRARPARSHRLQYRHSRGRSA